MNYTVNPINSNTGLSPLTPLAQYKQAQESSVALAQTVYSALYALTNSQDSGINLESLINLKKLLENEKRVDSNVYKLVDTMIEKFGVLSTDGSMVTSDDFSAVIKFSVTQKYTLNGGLSSILNGKTFNVSKDLEKQFGTQNVQILAIMSFLDSLSEETIGKIAAKMNTAKARESVDHRVYADNIQEYNTVTKQQLISPISISI